VIPTALSVVSLITGPLLARHPRVRVQVRSLSSIEIGRRLADHEIDAGITYLDNEPLGAVVATPIYDERYLFLTRSEEPEGTTIGWSELTGVPLCLLSRDMQNRRIVDAALRDAGVEPAPRVEANSISALLSFARSGWSCVMAHTWLALQSAPSGMRALDLTDPVITHSVGLVALETDLVHPIVRALRDELSAVDIDAVLAGG
jgi:DNA-binding transcriptional LysR family regulator